MEIRLSPLVFVDFLSFLLQLLLLLLSSTTWISKRRNDNSHLTSFSVCSEIYAILPSAAAVLVMNLLAFEVVITYQKLLLCEDKKGLLEQLQRPAH